jgi:carboxymethylenebutenolidase
VFLQEIFGVTDQLKRLAAWYADEGFTVAIPALFDRVQKNCVVPFDQSPRGIELMSSIARADTLLDIEAVVKTLNKKHSKVVVMGFCLGGGWIGSSCGSNSEHCRCYFVLWHTVGVLFG